MKKKEIKSKLSRIFVEPIKETQKKYCPEKNSSKRRRNFEIQ
jgi:hypothetical protein